MFRRFGDDISKARKLTESVGAFAENMHSRVRTDARFAAAGIHIHISRVTPSITIFPPVCGCVILLNEIVFCFGEFIHRFDAKVVFPDNVVSSRPVSCLLCMSPKYTSCRILLLQNYSAFARMTDFCKTRVPSDVREALQPIMSDDEAVKDYGVALGIRMCKDLTEAGVPGEDCVLCFFCVLLYVRVRRSRELGGGREARCWRFPPPFKVKLHVSRCGWSTLTRTLLGVNLCEC